MEDEEIETKVLPPSCALDIQAYDDENGIMTVMVSNGIGRHIVIDVRRSGKHLRIDVRKTSRWLSEESKAD